MKKPAILVTMSNANSSALESVTGDTAIIYSDRATAAAIIEAGGTPLYTPSVSSLSASDLTECLRHTDAVLISGADTNVNPLHYQEEPTHQEGRVDNERDRADMALIKLAYEQRLPLLGICKGMQAIAVALGGALYQNVAVQHPGAFDHDIKKASRSDATHKASLVSGSMLSQIFRSGHLFVNGGHQQAVKRLPRSLKPVAVAEDGVVEAFEGVDYPFLLGIQFHAELRMFDPTFAEIFEQFIAAAKDYKK